MSEHEMWPRRLSFRMWLSRRNPFVIGMVYGFMLPAYVVEGWIRAFRVFVDVGREWQRDRDFMVQWSQVPASPTEEVP